VPVSLVSKKENQIVSPRTANKPSMAIEETSDNPTAKHQAEDPTQTGEAVNGSEGARPGSDAEVVVVMNVTDAWPDDAATANHADGCTASVEVADSADNAHALGPGASRAPDSQECISQDPNGAGAENENPVVVGATDPIVVATDEVDPSAVSLNDVPGDETPRNSSGLEIGEDQAVNAEDDPSAPRLPDPSTISERLRSLVLAVNQVEELSRKAREVAANDLALYNGIAASQQQFEEGLAEARRIGQEAQSVYDRAFGHEARAVAEPAVAEAREVEHAFEELAHAWRQQAESFLAEHPDVEALLLEQREREDGQRLREHARAKAQRFQELVNAADAALSQGLLDDAGGCLRMLAREFPSETDRLAPLQHRLDRCIRNSNDAAAKRVLDHASELQARGDFDAAVKLLEAVDVSGLSREVSEDVFGGWSAACSLLGQTTDLELVRSSFSQGRGIILHRDPGVPYGLVVLSALGMDRPFKRGSVISRANKEGAAIIARARAFRPANFPAELGTSWYGRSYVIGSAAGSPVHH
jgi:tetratricopeptide (TPR) repeat protein